jgi:hypothetical protein
MYSVIEDHRPTRLSGMVSMSDMIGTLININMSYSGISTGTPNEANATPPFFVFILTII